jgi:3D-(3,5/4)-trihydroxycyclohexane-1,2-dione acylhydrolase (decyclizing)
METIRLTMAQALVRWLTAQKTEIDGQVVPLFPAAFGIFGHGNVTALAEALAEVKDSFPTYRGHNEQSMALSAIAYAKAMRRKQIMVATSSIGPGSTNMVTAAGVAITNRLPVLLLSGDTFAHRIVDPVLQQVEQFGDPTITAADTFKPVTRFWDRIVKPEQLVKSLPQALAVMLDPADCGPAFIALPQDVQAEAYDYPTKFFEEKVHYIRRPQADPREIAAAAEVIASAKKPIVISGGGVLYSGAIETLTEFAAKHNIPVTETFAGKGAFVDSNPNYAGSLGIAGDACSNAIAEDADVVIAVGTKLQDFTTGSWALFKDPKVRIVAINAARWDAMKQSATGVIGDADASLSRSTMFSGTMPHQWNGSSGLRVRRPHGTPTSTNSVVQSAIPRPTTKSSSAFTKCATTVITSCRPRADCLASSSLDGARRRSTPSMWSSASRAWATRSPVPLEPRWRCLIATSSPG